MDSTVSQSEMLPVAVSQLSKLGSNFLYVVPVVD